MSENRNILLLDPTIYEESVIIEQNPKKWVKDKVKTGVDYVVDKLTKRKLVTPKPKPKPKPRPRSRPSLKDGIKYTQKQLKKLAAKMRQNPKWTAAYTITAFTATVLDGCETISDRIKQAKQNSEKKINQAFKEGYIDLGISKISSSDVDIEFFKDFFRLYNYPCYRSKNTSWQNVYVYQDPGTYCVNGSDLNTIDEWYLANRTKFIEDFYQREEEEQKQLTSEYAKDFISKFDKKLMVDDSIRDSILESLFPMENRGGGSMWFFSRPGLNIELAKQRQLNGKYPSIVDSFLLFFKFIYSLSTRGGKFSSEVQSISNRVKDDPKNSIEDIKNRVFSDYLNKSENQNVLDKWFGFTTNITLDPMARRPLGFYMDAVEAYSLGRPGGRRGEGDTPTNFIADLAYDMTYYQVRDYVLLNLANEVAAKFRSGKKFDPRTIFFTSFALGVTEMALPFLPGTKEWFTISDEVVDELQKANSGLKKMVKIIDNNEMNNSEDISLLREEFRNVLLANSEVTRLIHNLVIEKLQENITSKRYTQEKLEYGNMLKTALEDLKSAETAIENNLEGMENYSKAEWKTSIGYLSSWYDSQLASFLDTEAEYKVFNHKLARSLEIGKLIRGMESMDESNKLKNHPIFEQKFEDNFENTHEEMCIFFQKIYGFNPKDVHNEDESEIGEMIARVRRFRRDEYRKMATVNSRLKNILNEKESFGVADKVKYFIRWWRATYDVGTDRGDENYTIHDSRWVNQGFGLRSNDSLTHSSYGVFIKNALAGKDIQAVAAIGLSYYTSNTSFYYAASGDVINRDGSPGGRELNNLIKKRSRTKKSGASQISYSSGAEIQRLRNLIDMNFLPSTAVWKQEENKWKEYVAGLQSRASQGGGSDQQTAGEYKVASNLAHVFYRRQKKNVNILNKILNQDDLITNMMIKSAQQLESRRDAGSAGHMSIVSKLRKLSAIKIALFQAAMDVIR